MVHVSLVIIDILIKIFWICQEELRCKLAKLEVAHRNEMNRFASAISQIDKYVEERQEMDRRFDQQYRRKMYVVSLLCYLYCRY